MKLEGGRWIRNIAGKRIIGRRRGVEGTRSASAEKSDLGGNRHRDRDLRRDPGHHQRVPAGREMSAGPRRAA
jgi:hypothetical protein